MVAFSHLDDGTTEDVWRDDGRIRTARPLDDDFDELLVVAAHPDDETLGAGGLIRRVHEARGNVTVVVATDGEASHPNSPSHSRTDLSALRREEVVRAIHILAPEARVLFLGLPDGRLREHTASLKDGLTEAVQALAAPADRVLIVAPWSGDGHRDHRVAAEAVARVANRRGLRHLGYPIWLWHWGRPENVAWDDAVVLALTPGERSIKAQALRTHASQMQPLSDAPGDEPVVSEAMQAHFDRDTELFFLEERDASESLPAAWFEDFYARHDDPWGFETRWYEQRKRALLLASLPSQRLGRVLEIGCSTGHVTVELAPRADLVLGLDPSAAAVAAARARLGPVEHVTFEQSAVPGDWPPGTFDTIVLSEVGYYLSEADLHRTIELIEGALDASGCVVACHWRHPVAEYPLTGDEVHRALRSVHAWETLASHEEEDFVLEVFCRRPAISVAHREGLS